MTETPTGSDEAGSASAQTDQTSDDAEYYRLELDKALELLANKDRVNEIIAGKTDRPELLMHQSAKMQEMDWSSPDPWELNNFGPYLIATGAKVISKEVVPGSEEVGGLTGEEFLMKFGGRGIESFDFLKTEGLGSGSIWLFMATHVSREAFVRMYMLFPDLTKKIIADYVPNVAGDNIRVAYEIMSRLVDVKDSLVTKEDGSIDEIYLTR